MKEEKEMRRNEKQENKTQKKKRQKEKIQHDRNQRNRKTKKKKKNINIRLKTKKKKRKTPTNVFPFPNLHPLIPLPSVTHLDHDVLRGAAGGREGVHHLLGLVVAVALEIVRQQLQKCLRETVLTEQLGEEECVSERRVWVYGGRVCV